MLPKYCFVPAVLLLAAGLSLPAAAQAPPDPAALIEAQREAMQALAFLDGRWEGPAWTLTPTGAKHALTQTERGGPFLGGAIRMVEGRGHEPDGTVSFNALGVVSFDPAAGTYSMRSYAMGRSGDFTLVPTEEGFSWEIPAGPATIRYTAVVKNGTWHEVGDRVVPGQEPLRFFEMTLTRVGDTAWPGGE